MAHGRSRCFYRRQETLALARRRSGRLCSRRSRSKPPRPESRPPAHAQTAAKDNQGAARHDHGQAALLWRGPQGYGAEGGASPTQGLEQPGGEFASAGAATREDHEALQIGATCAAVLVHSRSARQSLSSSAPRTSDSNRPPHSPREGDRHMARNHGRGHGFMILEARLTLSLRHAAIKLTVPSKDRSFGPFRAERSSLALAPLEKPAPYVAGFLEVRLECSLEVRPGSSPRPRASQKTAPYVAVFSRPQASRKTARKNNV